MEFRNIGKSGLRTSLLGLGCNNFGFKIDERQSIDVINAALECGINFFDTANSYGGGRSEEVLGHALARQRSDVVIATKIGMRVGGSPYDEGLSRKAIVKAVDDSLHRLKSDYIDLLYLHKPDDACPIEESLLTLDDLVRRGKALYIGLSNYPSWMLVEAVRTATSARLTVPAAATFEWSLLAREAERECVPACDYLGIGVVPYFPLAAGLLSGKYGSVTDLPPGTRIERARAALDAADADASLAEGAENQSRLLRERHFLGFVNERNIAAAGILNEFAQDHEATLLQLALRWLASQPTVASIIAGATSPQQIQANAAAMNSALDPSVLADLTKTLDVMT